MIQNWTNLQAHINLLTSYKKTEKKTGTMFQPFNIGNKKEVFIVHSTSKSDENK